MRRAIEILLAVLLPVAPLWAGLGQPAASVEADRQSMAGKLRSQVFSDYTVHEISAPDGQVVREYVSPSGVVFGVVWEGPTLPNVTQLLGSYSALLQQARRSPTLRHGPLYIQSGPLVVASGGHARAFRGRAYVTTLIPAGLTEAVLR